VSDTATADREIVLTRTFAAPRELVFRVWTDPAHLNRWWGPRGFTTTTRAMAFRPGGMWRFVMHGPDGTDYVNRIVYTAIVPAERIAYDHDDDGVGKMTPFRAEATFADEGAGTRVTLRMVCASAEQRDAMVQFGAVAGGEQTLARLGEYASDLGDPACEIVSTRTFPVPPAQVFAAFTDPERLKRWWGPDGFTNTFHEFDFRPGGMWRFVMHGPDGTNYVNESQFLEVVDHERIVFDHLRTMHRFRMAMTFAGRGETTLTWRQRFETAAECEKVKAFAGPANEQNFDRLAAVLAG
jgi:uncharacterized protein YndB with AHSA1/START domain